MAPPIRFSASYTAICHAGQIVMSCWTVSRVLLDTLTSDQGLANDMVISLQSGRPEVINYQKTSCLEKEKLYGRRRARVIWSGRRGMRGTETRHYLGQQPKRAHCFERQDRGPDLGSQHWSRGRKQSWKQRSKPPLLML